MKDILNSHPVSVLKKEISKSNIKGYSKMKKPQIVELMLKHKDKFSHIKMAEKKVRKPPMKKSAPAKKVEPKKKTKDSYKDVVTVWNDVNSGYKLRSKQKGKLGKLNFDTFKKNADKLLSMKPSYSSNKEDAKEQKKDVAFWKKTTRRYIKELQKRI